MTDSPNSPYLLAAVKETNDRIRSYDTKAQIVGIGFIFTLSMITNFIQKLGPIREPDMMSIIGFWVVTIVPIMMFGAVVYPGRTFADIDKNPTHPASFLLYPNGNKSDAIEDYMGELQSADWERELAMELITNNQLRQVKRQRFIRALFAAACSLLIIASYQIIRF